MKPQKKIIKRTAVEMRLTLDNLIQHYLNNQQLRGLRPDTIDSARKVLGRMARALGGSTAIKDLSDEAIEGYALSLQTRTTRYNGHPYKNGPVEGGLSPFTVRKEIKTIRAFGNWLAEEGWPNPFDVLIMPKKPKRIIEVLSDEEIERLFSSVNPTTEMGARTHAILMLFLSSGLRLNEVATARMENLSLDTRRLKVQGKGNKDRVVSFGIRCAQALSRYINVYRPQPVEEDTVFLAPDGVPMTRESVGQVIRRLKRRSGIKRLHPHLLRHTFAVRYLVSGGDLVTLQAMLGHESLEVTQIYLHLSAQQVHTRHQAHDPMDNLILHTQRRFGFKRRKVSETTTLAA